METITVNYWAIMTGAVLSMVIGAIWYGPIFGNKWAEIICTDMSDSETRKKMKKSAGPLYRVSIDPLHNLRIAFTVLEVN